MLQYKNYLQTTNFVCLGSGHGHWRLTLSLTIRADGADTRPPTRRTPDWPSRRLWHRPAPPTQAQSAVWPALTYSDRILLPSVRCALAISHLCQHLLHLSPYPRPSSIFNSQSSGGTEQQWQHDEWLCFWMQWGNITRLFTSEGGVQGFLLSLSFS